MNIFCVITVLFIAVVSKAELETGLNEKSVNRDIYKENSEETVLNRVVRQDSKSMLWKNPYPIAYAVVVTVIVMVIVLMAFCCFSGSGKRVDQIYDGCTSSTAYYKYMVKFHFGPHSAKYFSKTAQVAIDFIEDRRLFITRIAIPPQWMSKRRAIYTPTKEYKKFWITKFQLNRGVPLSDIAFVRLSHNCFKETLKVYYIEVKDLMANALTLIPISTDITSLGPDSKPMEQNFKSKILPITKQDEDDMFLEGITPYITIPEFTMFAAFYVCLNLLLVLFVPYKLRLTTVSAGLISGALSSLIALVLTVGVIILYKTGVKRGYASNHGTGAWGCIRWTFLLGFLLLSALFAIAAGIIASAFDDNMFIFWIVGTILAVFILIVLYMPICMFLSLKTGFIESGKVKTKSLRKLDENPIPLKPYELGIAPKSNDGSKISNAPSKSKMSDSRQ